MTTEVLVFFNNKGGVGKTSLVYHLAWMYSDLGRKVIAADLDPQANLTSAFIDEEALERFWEDKPPRTIMGSINPLIKGTGDVNTPYIERIDDRLGLVVGDLMLSGFEDALSSEWPNCLDRQERAFRVISAFWRVLQLAASEFRADIILVDVGPNLGAINRAVLIASSYVVVPLAPDLFSLQGLRNLGPKLRSWRNEWHERLKKRPQDISIELPKGEMRPIGYVVLQHAVRLDRPVKSYEKWMARIPKVYSSAVIDKPYMGTTESDPNCLATLKHYRSLMPMAQEARKPIFHLTPADGAGGAHLNLARKAGEDFKFLAQKIAERAEIPL